MLSRIRPKAPIALVLNSPGGHIVDGFHFHDDILELRDKGHHVTIRVRGEACSMASVVLQAADARVIGPSATVMIHQSSGGAEGQRADIADAAQLMKKYEHRICEIFAQRSGRPLKVFKELLEKRKDIWMNAQEALKEKLVDSIG